MDTLDYRHAIKITSAMFCFPILFVILILAVPQALPSDDQHIREKMR